LAFETGGASRVNEAVEMVIIVDWHCRVAWSAIKVVMVIMTFDGGPTGVAHGHSTGEIIFIQVG